MGRNRKSAYQKLPKYFYVQRKRLIYAPPNQKPLTVGLFEEMTMADIWEEHEKLTRGDMECLGYIFDRYRESDRFLALESGGDVEKHLEKFFKIIPKHKHPRQIKPVTIRQYMDIAGSHSKSSANRHHSAVSAMWSWAQEYGYTDEPNPCKSVRKFPEQPRSRYVTDKEYKLVYDAAEDYMKVAMELAYLCRMRRSEVLDVRCRDVEDEGLNTRRIKGSNSALTLWSDRLREAIDLGLKGKIRVPDMLIVTNNNTNIRPNTFSINFGKHVESIDVEPFTFHDLKAKGVSDFEGDKKAASGHKSEAMVAIYDRKRKSVEATE